MKDNLKLSIIPFITFSLCCFFALVVQNSYLIDPDFVYLVNGLNVFHGNFEDIIHVDHPGTPLQILIGILMPIIAFFRNASDVTKDVFLNPDVYIKSIIIFIAFWETLVLFLIGKTYYKHNKNFFHTLILQSAILVSSTVILFYMKIFTETLIPLGVLLLILVLIKKINNEIKDLKYSILAGIIIGLFIATKITFAPLFLLAILMIEKYRNIAVFLCISAISFLLGVLPVIGRISYFQKFLFNVATHDGSYGTGNEEVFNPIMHFNNIKSLLSTEWAFTIVFVLAIITLVINIIKDKKNFFKQIELKLLLAITTTTFIHLIIVSKHGGMRYLAPSLLLTSLSIILIIKYFPIKKQFSIIFVSIISLFILQSHTLFITKYVKETHQQNKMYSFINENIYKDDAVLIVTDESWIGSPFQEHSIMFGKLYCYRQGYKYNEILNELYPNRYFWTHHNAQYADWESNQMTELLLEKHHDNLYLYLQYVNTDLQQKVLHDFSNPRNISSKDVIITKIYEDKKLKEEIYQIKLKNKPEIKPKYEFSTNFEESSKENARKILTNQDSIFVNDGNFRTDYIAFEGNYSLSISAEREFGLSIPLENIELHDFIKVEMKCKRNNPSSEFAMIIKNAHDQDGFYTFISGAPTSENNNWETLTFTYRIVNQPKEGLLEIYFWNNSKKDIFVDDFRIRIY